MVAFRLGTTCRNPWKRSLFVWRPGHSQGMQQGIGLEQVYHSAATHPGALGETRPPRHNSKNVMTGAKQWWSIPHSTTLKILDGSKENQN
mmetsp:Transcript_11168/g.27449  ORF Transcript_11168/g.27449 Transcript_11168/m.27449 type:complete len:90 (-) Transcript_11168:18-287(-)